MVEDLISLRENLRKLVVEYNEGLPHPYAQKLEEIPQHARPIECERPCLFT